MKIHINDYALRRIPQKRPPEREGRLSYRTSKGIYKERWFRLHGNLLFYYRTNDLGAALDLSDPVGVLVLVKLTAQMETRGDLAFVFSVVFDGEAGKKHFFSGQSDQVCRDWVEAIRNSTHETLTTKLKSLREQVQQLTGQYPLESRAVSRTHPQPAKLVAPVIPPASSTIMLPAKTKGIQPPSSKTATFYVTNDKKTMTAVGITDKNCATDMIVERLPAPAKIPSPTPPSRRPVAVFYNPEEMDKVLPKPALAAEDGGYANDDSKSQTVSQSPWAQPTNKWETFD